MIADILCERFGSCSWKAELLERKPGVSDYETLQANRNWIVGVFVVVGLVAFGWLVFKFGDLPSGVSQWTSFDVYVQFSSAPGVQRDTPVRFCGYQVGRVTQVIPPRRLPEIRNGLNVGPESYQITVVMSIENRYTDIPLDSRIKLMTRGFGSSYIEIQPSLPDPCSPPQAFWVHGSRVQGSVGITSELFPEQTQRKLEELVGDLRVFIGHANQIVGDPNSQQNIKTILANLSESSKRTVQVLERAEQTLSHATEAIEQYRQLAVAGQDTLRKIGRAHV
jgi:ABC-type transporter Mla subunit MlaD